MATAPKKRRVEDELRVFQKKWTECYFFIDFTTNLYVSFVMNLYLFSRNIMLNVIMKLSMQENTSLTKDNFGKIKY